MKILHREWFNVTRSDVWTLYPLGDVHLGNEACDESLFRATVKRIADDDRALWGGVGDYCELVNLSDPRFDVASLASWVKMQHMADLAKAQRDRFIDAVRPIAGKCLGLIEGNHERAIKKHYERDIYADIVTGVKDAGGFPADHNLAFGYSGWLMLHFYRAENRTRGTLLKLNLHHGFVGGKLAGAKALNMQRWLWTHAADLVLFGHSHASQVQVEAVETVRGSKIVREHRIGMSCGSFMSNAGYAEVKGYFPLPVTTSHIILQPGANAQRDRIKVVTNA